MTVTFLQVSEPGSVGSQVVIKGRLPTHVRFARRSRRVKPRAKADYDGHLFAMRRPLRAHIGRGDAVNVGAIAPRRPPSQIAIRTANTKIAIAKRAMPMPAGDRKRKNSIYAPPARPSDDERIADITDAIAAVNGWNRAATGFQDWRASPAAKRATVLLACGSAAAWPRTNPKFDDGFS